MFTVMATLDKTVKSIHYCTK